MSAGWLPAWRQHGGSAPPALRSVLSVICVADWTVLAVLEDRYLPCRVLSRGTAGQYRWAVSHFDRLCGPRCGGPVTLSRLSMELLCHYVRLGLAEGTSMATLKRRVAVIRTLWDFAEAEGLTTSRACRPLKLREPRRLPNAWRPAELAAIDAACERWRPSKYGRPHSKLWTPKHWRALLALILDTGERIEAMIKC